MNNKNIHAYLLKILTLIAICFGLCFTGCADKDKKSTLGAEYITSQVGYTLVDTLSVALSTVIIDSLQTNGTGNMLLGNYTDETFGKISCSSFFQIGIPDTFDVQTCDRYDSLLLVITYNNYAFGDTTNSQNIRVHQLLEQINDDTLITNESTVAYQPEPIGSLTYYPRPNHSTDTLCIHLDDVIGRDLFNKLKENAEMMSNVDLFIEYFKGLVLLTDNSNEEVIIGFNANSVDAKLVLYTSRIENNIEQIFYEFGLYNTSLQFNTIAHDFSSTQLYKLSNQEIPLSFTETDGMAFLHGGIGLAIRVDFPTLEEILLLHRGQIVKAVLSLGPLQGSYNEFNLPESIYAYESDILNNLDYQGTLVSSTLTVDELYHEESCYTFDITEYLNNEIADSYINPEKGLLITLLAEDLVAGLERLVIDANNKKTNLKIYYLSY